MVTGLALFVPGHRALAREIAQERRELALSSPPAWRRLWLDVLLLSPPRSPSSSSCDRARSMLPRLRLRGPRRLAPASLLLVPLLAWVGSVLLASRLLVAIASRLPVRAAPELGGAVRGLLLRSLRRRPWELAAGTVALGLVIAFGTSLRSFIATYDAAKRADAGFVVGSDVRIAPGARPRTAAYASGSASAE